MFESQNRQAAASGIQNPAPRTSSESDEIKDAATDGNFSAHWKVEALGIFVLASMVAYFLGISWRKWPDPIVDFGPQLYATWRVSEGAGLYHDFLWNYGPLSVCFNAVLFKLFGPGIMVLATANLVFYALIASLAYIAFRMAWGRLGAFAAMAVFISVFSFSHLLGVGNYNFVTPYAAEATHGMLLILITGFIVVRWCRRSSRWLAFWLGLCGGLSAVMKPEFMLAGGLLGIVALMLRWRQGVPVRLEEFALIGGGLVLPTLAFTAWFARAESVKEAFIDASQAWWLVLVTRVQGGDVQQLTFLGLNHPGSNVMREIVAGLWAVSVMGAIWAAGWIVNRRWSWVVRVAVAAAALTVPSFVRLNDGRISISHGLIRLDDDWIFVGRCLPGLIVVMVVLIALRLKQELRDKVATQSTLMRFALVLLAGAMLARMPFSARISHLGFFQAALAAMVIAAMMVSELPLWTGTGIWGRRVTVCGFLLVLALGCASIAAKSRAIRADQTEPIGSGRDRFYSTTRMIDGTGALVNWTAEHLRSAPTDSTVLVLPEGVMINYLSHHKSPEPGWARGKEKEKEFVEQLRTAPPEYVVLISRDLKEFGIAHYGASGNQGETIVQWVSENYRIEHKWGGDPLNQDDMVGAIILRRKIDGTGNIEVLSHKQ